MTIDFTSLQTETVQYFVLNSGTFVAGLGLLFFLLGLTFGGLTWRRYRHRWLGAVEDEKKLRSEVADLQKQLAEREAPKPTEPPSLKEAPKTPEPPPALEKPALTEMPDLTSPKVAAPVAVAALASAELPKFELPSIPDLPTLSPSPEKIGVTSLAQVAPVPLAETTTAQSPPKPESTEEKPEDDGDESEPEIQPFSFLLSDDPEEPAAQPPSADLLIENKADADEAEPFGFIIEEDEETPTPAPEEPKQGMV